MESFCIILKVFESKKYSKHFPAFTTTSDLKWTPLLEQCEEWYREGARRLADAMTAAVRRL